MACSTGTPAKDCNTQLLNGIFKLNRQDKLVGGSAAFVFYTQELRQRGWFVPGDSNGCDLSGVQIQTRTRCLQHGSDGLVALALCRLDLQLECVIQVCCVWEMAPEGKSFPSLDPTPPLEMGSSSMTSWASDEDKSHPAPSFAVSLNTCLFLNHWVFVLWRWGAPGPVRGGRRRFTWISCAGMTLRNGWDKPCYRCGEMSWSSASSEVLPCGLDTACICSDMVQMRENSWLHQTKTSEILKSSVIVNWNTYVEFGPILSMFASKHCAQQFYSRTLILKLSWTVAQIRSYYECDMHCRPQRKNMLFERPLFENVGTCV